MGAGGILPHCQLQCRAGVQQLPQEEGLRSSIGLPVRSHSHSQVPTPRRLNFVGRLAREILRQTHYRVTTYLDEMSGWFDERGRELIGIRTFTLLNKSIGVFGVTGLDRLYCFMIVKSLQDLVQSFREQIKTLTPYLSKVTSELQPTSIIPSSADRVYQEAIRATAGAFDELVPAISRIGQIQLIRKHIANDLNFSGKIDSKTLFYSLDSMNVS